MSPHSPSSRVPRVLLPQHACHSAAAALDAARPRGTRTLRAAEGTAADAAALRRDGHLLACPRQLYRPGHRSPSPPLSSPPVFRSTLPLAQASLDFLAPRHQTSLRSPLSPAPPTLFVVLYLSSASPGCRRCAPSPSGAQVQPINNDTSHIYRRHVQPVQTGGLPVHEVQVHAGPDDTAPAGCIESEIG